MMFLRKKEKGFTLIEVMLVVIIIGIIAIIALPKLLVTKQTAEEKSCQSNVQAITTQLEQYLWNEGTYPDELEGVSDDFINNPEYFPLNSSVSADCPLDADGTPGGDPLIYTPATPDADGNILNYTLICPNGHVTLVSDD